MKDKIEQLLLEKIADFLDSEEVIFEQECNGISEGVPREESDLHIEMAAAAMAVYRKKMKI